MKDRSLLMSFFFGVILTGFCASLGMIGIAHNMNHKWEQDAFNHGFGYFTFPILHPEQMTFHWFESLPDRQDNTRLQKINLTAVHVLAEPNIISREDADILRSGSVCVGGEARESTSGGDNVSPTNLLRCSQDSCGGGQSNLSGGATTDEAKATQQRVGGVRAVDQALSVVPVPTLAVSYGDSGSTCGSSGEARESVREVVKSTDSNGADSRGGDYFLSGSAKVPNQQPTCGGITTQHGIDTGFRAVSVVLHSPCAATTQAAQECDDTRGAHPCCHIAAASGNAGAATLLI